MQMRRWLDRLVTVLLWMAVAAGDEMDDSNLVAAPRGWSEDEWFLRAQSNRSLCPEGCECSPGRLDCAGGPHTATHLVVRGIPLHDALASRPDANEGEIQSPLGPAKALRRLAIRDCALSALHPWILEHLRELREADLSRNSLRNLTGDVFASCHKLEKLFLSGNPLGSVPTLERKGLRWLQLDNCSIQEMPEGVFKGTPQVMYLSMRSNSLSSLSAIALQTLRELIHLHLEHNALQNLQPTTFTRHRLLQTLYLKGNPIQLPEDKPFLESTSLLILDLRACGLRNISNKTFSRLPLLRSLLLAQNAIETLPVDVLDKMQHLQILDLSYNKMTTLDPLVFRVLRFKAHALLDVSGNPLGCSCLVLKCRETPKRCSLKSASLVWSPTDDSDVNVCTEEERASCLAGGAGSGAGDDEKFYEQFGLDPPPDINSILRPKLDEETKVGAGVTGDSILSLENRSTQVAMGISGAVVFVIVIAVTVYMARRCRKDERLRRVSSDDIAEEATLTTRWTVMDPDTLRAAAASTTTSDGVEVIRTPQGSSAGGVGDGWRLPRSHKGPSLDEPLERIFLDTQATPVHTGTFRRQHTDSHRPSIQHHRRFDSED